MKKQITLSKGFVQSLLNKKMRLLVVAGALVTCGIQAQIVTVRDTINYGDPENTAGSGTWTCPAGVIDMIVECWGGGGAGGSTSNYENGIVAYKSSVRGGAGAGGSYANKTIVGPSGNYNYAIGAGGIAPVATMSGSGNAAGTVILTNFTDLAVFSGGTTTFGESTVVAVGGNGGQSRTILGGTTDHTVGLGGTKVSTGNIGDVMSYGGAGADGPPITIVQRSAASGGSAGAGGDGGDVLDFITAGLAGANGGILGTGGGVAGVGSTSTSTYHGGTNGIVPGGGGSGATCTPANANANANYRKGGNGGNGRIIIIYRYLSTGLSTNQANAYVTVDGNSLKLHGNVTAVEVFDAQGRRFVSQANVTSVNVKGNGIFIVKMHTAQGVNVQKVII